MCSVSHDRDVTACLQRLLRREGHIFKTSSEFEIVRQIKEVHHVLVVLCKSPKSYNVLSFT